MGTLLQSGDRWGTSGRESNARASIAGDLGAIQKIGIDR